MTERLPSRARAAAAGAGAVALALTGRAVRSRRRGGAGGRPVPHDDVGPGRGPDIIESSSEAFVAFDLEGRVVDFNPEAERLFGWPRQEILGRRLIDTVVAPESHRRTQAALRQFGETGEWRILGRHVELAARNRAGRVFPVEVTAWPTSEGGRTRFNAFVQDISRRHDAEEALHRLAAIVEYSDDAIVGMDLEGTITTWNQGAERMYGYAADQIVGRSISLIVPPEARSEADRYLTQVRLGKPVQHHETVRLTRAGTLLDVALTVSPIRDQTGRIVGASTIARDITEQRWMAATLDATLAALEKAAEEAMASEERTRRFLADAAHQLRTPVAGMRACAETLLRGPAEDERDRLLAHLVRETSRASRLVTSLLQIARLDQGQSLVLQPCDVVALCEDEAERARTLAPELTVSVRADGVRPAKPDLDVNAVREILANLLDNARRHASSTIDVVVGRTDVDVEIRVVNDGPPLDDSTADRAFERFVSLDGRKGSGLGLPIGRGLARAHGGDLTYENGTFVIRLPAKAATRGGSPS